MIQHTIFTGLMAFALIAPMSEAAANMNKPSQPLATTSPKGHQPIKAEIIDPSPSHLTINVKKFANLGADESAPTFALYTTAMLPRTCGDFSALNIAYEKPSKYTRVFDLSRHRDVLKAIRSYGCVVVKNIPPTSK